MSLSALRLPYKRVGKMETMSMKAAHPWVKGAAVTDQDVVRGAWLPEPREPHSVALTLSVGA